MVFYPEWVSIGSDCKIDDSVKFIRSENLLTASVKIGNGVTIRAGSIIYANVAIADNTVIDHYVIIRENTAIGSECRIVNNTEIGNKVIVGSNCRLGGRICNRSIIGNGSIVLGNLLHRNDMARIPAEEASPHIGDGVFIAREAAVIGDVVVPDGYVLKYGEVLK